MQVVADDFDVGALVFQIRLGKLGNLLSVRVVLIDQVDLLDLRLGFHESGERLHLHGRIGIEAIVPVAALAVGQVGVDGCVVEVQQLFARIAGVVLFNRIDDRQRRSGAIALDDVARALVLRRAQSTGGFLRAQLVVDGNDLELDARRVLLVELFGKVLESLELIRANCCHESGQGIKPADLDCLTLLRHGAADARQHDGGRNNLHGKFHSISPGSGVLKRVARVQAFITPKRQGMPVSAPPSGGK